MNEFKYVYEHYGVLGVVVALIIFVLWQKRDFFLSKSDGNKVDFENESDFPCCKRRAVEEILQKLEKIKNAE